MHRDFVHAKEDPHGICTSTHKVHHCQCAQIITLNGDQVGFFFALFPWRLSGEERDEKELRHKTEAKNSLSSSNSCYTQSTLRRRGMAECLLSHSPLRPLPLRAPTQQAAEEDIMAAS